MKRTIIILFLLNTLSSFSQNTFRFINGESNEPMTGVYSNIYKNENSFVNCGCCNEEGYYTPYIRKYDSTAQYQFSLNFMKYEPVWKEIDITKSDTLVIHVFKDEYYIENCDSLFTKRSSIYSWGKYTPRRIRSYNDIPANIAIKVKDYLNERVGNQLSTDFELVDGQIVELDKFEKYFPGSNKKTSYYLGLSYRNLESGISMYASNLEFDENGNVVKNLQFPIVKNDTIPFKIYSYKKIKQKAFEEGFFFPDRTKIDMEYNEGKKILTWRFFDYEQFENNTYEQKIVFYNAHNGERIETKITKGELIE